MKHNLLISNVSRWLDLNEYESQITGFINGIEISCHFVDITGQYWTILSKGVEIEVDIFLVRTGKISRIENKKKGLERDGQYRDNVHYRVYGMVNGAEENECIVLDTVMPLTVHLDIPHGQFDNFVFSVGSFIELTGVLEMKICD